MEVEQPSAQLTHYERYRESLLKAARKWYSTHQHLPYERYGEKMKAYQKSRYESDPEYRERKKAQALERYYKKKAQAAALANA